MSNTSWKTLEREVGRLTNTRRYPANQGGRVDCESDQYVIQCKERRSLSLEQLTQLVEEIEGIAKERGKRGLVAVKVRRGRGKASPILFVQSAEQWAGGLPRRLPLSTQPLVEGIVLTEYREPEWIDNDYHVDNKKPTGL